MDGWCFALVNGKLAEIYHEKVKGETKFLGHCYVLESEYKTKKEKTWIRHDTSKFQFSYRKNKYRDKNTNKIFTVIEDSDSE